MGGRPVGRISAALLAIALVAVSREAHAQKVAVVDFYGEADVRDEAGAVTLLVRSALVGDRLQTVSRADLEAAFIRAQVQRAGNVRRLSLDQLRDLLVSTGAGAVVTGEVLRSGAELRATALVLRSGAAIHVITARAGDGNVPALADALGQGLAAHLKSAARPRPNTSLGRLRGFVAADAALRMGEPARALEALRAADPQAAGRAAAAREVPGVLLADTGQTVAARIDAALIATDPDRALELAAAALKTSRSDPVGALGAARAHLSRMNVQAAAAALAPLETSTDPAVLAVRAEMAHYAEDRGLRDQLIAGLLTSAPAAALPVVDLVAPGELPAELEARALAAAEALQPSWLRSAIGVRAAAGKVEVARALALVRVSDLDEGDLALARSSVGGAAGSPEGMRVAAELALFDADYRSARGAVDRWVAAAPADARAQLQLGRLLVQEGKPRDGAAALGRAVQGGIASARREQAVALYQAGDLAAAQAILAKLDDEASVLALVAGALARLDAGDVAGARGDLERALSLSAANPDLLRALTRLDRERGGSGLTSDIKLLADKLAAPPAAPAAATAKPVDLPATGKKKVAAGPDGRLDAAIEKMLRGLPLGADARRVVVVPMSGQELPFWHWYQLDAGRVDASIHRVLERSGLSPADAGVIESEPLAADRLEQLAQKGKADAVVLYRVSAEGSRVEVKLVGFVPGNPAAAEAVEVIDGRATGLIGWNRLFLLAIALVIAALAAWAFLLFRRGSGALHVSFKVPAGASDETFALELTRSQKRPKFDLADFRSRMARAGHKVGRRSATMVSGTTSFRRVPAGRWYAHLIGAYTIAGETRVLDEKQTVAAQVNRKAATSITFDLGSSKAELLVRVYNPGGAQSGILVAIDERIRGRTDATGEVRLEVEPGKSYNLTVEAADLSYSQPISVMAPSVQRVAVHLDRERRRAELAGDIEIPQDDTELVIERHETEKVRTPARRPQSSQGAGPPGILMSATTLQAGDTIGKYQLVAELGRGAMGLVYRARDTKLERDVALKVISDELRSHPVAMQLFLDEAKALAQLNHPNIVGVYDQNEEMGITYMVMELVEGATLENILLQRGRLPVSEALEIIDQLCAGLAYAHERKVIHRDIKPANIFISEDRTVKLGDFGLARVMREIAIRRTEVRGTPLYMAPEQVTGTDVDRRADLYAVGCTLFEMLTGAPPFTDGDIMFQQLHTAPPRPSSKVGGLPPALDALVLSCLEKDRRARIDSATLIRERLKTVRP